MRRTIAMVIAAVMLASGCSTGTSDSPPDTGLPPDTDRCEEVDPLVLDFLRTGITMDGVDLIWGYAVKSTDYADVWIVAAGVEGGDELDYGTWAVRAGTWPTDYSGAVSINELAMTISDWGDQSDIIVTGATNGVYSAEACAIERLDADGAGG
jgi:hypothetical protein